MKLLKLLRITHFKTFCLKFMKNFYRILFLIDPQNIICLTLCPVCPVGQKQKPCQGRLDLQDHVWQVVVPEKMATGSCHHPGGRTSPGWWRGRWSAPPASCSTGRTGRSPQDSQSVKRINCNKINNKLRKYFQCQLRLVVAVISS